MERLDQGHLSPLLEQPRNDLSWPGIKPGPLRWEASTLVMSYFKAPVNSYLEHLLTVCARDIAPPSASVS